MENSELEKKLLGITRDFIEQLESGRNVHSVTLNASFQSDLGIGSLEKVELINRIEEKFGVRFSDEVINTSKTLKDLAGAIIQNQVEVAGEISGAKEILYKSDVDPSAARTVVELLQLYATADPQRTHVYLLDDNGVEKKITYGNLLEGAVLTAKGLVAKGIKPGDTVALMLTTSADFFYAFMGVMMAGAIPVPIYPPFRLDQIEDYIKREARILKNAETRILITFKQAQTLSKLLKSFIPSLKEVITVDALQSYDAELPNLEVKSTDAAFIQYTSGSTSDPKGVLLSHRNLITNIQAFGKVIGVTSADRVVSWLPLYHDMGLIGNWLGSLYYGIPVTIMSPLFFLNRPERWLWAIHYYRATISGGPNFAYELCVKKINDQMIQGLDLSSWRLAYNGAEAIYPKTLDAFSERFSPYRFKTEALYPVYGLAESTVGLCLSILGRKYRVDKISREAFERDRLATTVDESTTTNTLEFVSCGKPIPEHEIRIVNEDNEPLPERHVGNIEFRGPSMMQGYYRNAVATAAIFDETWMQTGDLGYIADAEIFVTGRKKDVIIKAGRNLYAAELEEIASQVEGVRKGCIAAFGVTNNKLGTENLIIVVETNVKNSTQRKKIIEEVTHKIMNEAGVPPDQVVLAPPRSIPKTSSGKLKRAACKEAYLNNKLCQKKMPEWLQLSKLALKSFNSRLSGVLQKTVYAIYSVYFYLISAVMFTLAATIILFTKRQQSIKICKGAARILMFLGFWSFKVVNNKKANNSAMIYVANHTSYTDFLVLLAALPANALFVGKQELLKVGVISFFIRKLGYLTVDRLDFSQSLTDMQKIKAVLQQGSSIIIFPEGTFTYATGLRPFKMGAFKIAVEMAVPICPVAIQGTRKILRDGSWLFRPAKVTVTINELLSSSSNDWAEMVRLRSLARNKIAEQCGEQILDNVSVELFNAPLQ